MTWFTTQVEKLGQVGVIRPLVLGVTVWLTYQSFTWGVDFADHSTRAGSDVAMILGAVMVPVSALQTFIFKLYLSSIP